MTRRLIALLAIAGVLVVFLYPLVNIPATKLKRTMLLTLAFAAFAIWMLAALPALARPTLGPTLYPAVPLTEVLCVRLC